MDICIGMGNEDLTSEEPLYVSKPHKGSWNQEYRIYRDRIELRARILFCTLRIPFSKIKKIVVRESRIVLGDMFLKPLEFWWTYNNDRGGRYHVYLHQQGWPSRIRFTPENPEAFVAMCDELRGQTRPVQATRCRE